MQFRDLVIGFIPLREKLACKACVVAGAISCLMTLCTCTGRRTRHHTVNTEWAEHSVTLPTTFMHSPHFTDLAETVSSDTLSDLSANTVSCEALKPVVNDGHVASRAHTLPIRRMLEL